MFVFSRSIYFYRVNIKHGQESSADAQGTKVLFMLTPYVRFKEITQQTIIQPTPIVEDDSVTIKVSDTLSHIYADRVVTLCF